MKTRHTYQRCGVACYRCFHNTDLLQIAGGYFLQSYQYGADITVNDIELQSDIE